MKHIIQWCLDYYTPLVHEPYVNGVCLNQDYILQKSFKRLGLWSPNRYEIDLSYEVLNNDLGQGDAKTLEVKDVG